MKDQTPVIERALEALRTHGACTLEQIAKHADTTVANLYNYVGTLKKLHGVVKHRDGKGPAIYALGKDAPPQRLDKKKAVRKPPKRAQRKPQRPVAAPPKPAQQKRTNGHAAFAINEDGQLGITKEGQKVSLDGQEFERLRGFIERTESVWKDASA